MATSNGELTSPTDQLSAPRRSRGVVDALPGSGFLATAELPPRIYEALKTLCCLAAAKKPLQTHEVVTATNLPPSQTAKILQQMTWLVSLSLVVEQKVVSGWSSLPGAFEWQTLLRFLRILRPLKNKRTPSYKLLFVSRRRVEKKLAESRSRTLRGCLRARLHQVCPNGKKVRQKRTIDVIEV
jgi:hypothetical protein